MFGRWGASGRYAEGWRGGTGVKYSCARIEILGLERTQLTIDGNKILDQKFSEKKCSENLLKICRWIFFVSLADTLV